MTKESYKKFAQKYVPFNIDDYDWFCVRGENEDVFLHIVVSTKRENESTCTFRFGSDYCFFKNDAFIYEVHNEWIKYKKNKKNSEIIK